MKVLITGGAGFIGSNLTSFHLDKKDEVWVVDNLITGCQKNIEPFKNNEKFKFFQQDVTTFDFSKFPKFNIIYHLASPASPPKFCLYPIEISMVNSLGTKNLLDLMLKTKSDVFVLASTSEVYGDPCIHPQNESYWGNVNPTGIRSCYDEGKRFAESITMTYFRKFNLDVRIARIFNTYGQNMEKCDGRVISNFITQALTGKPITIYGDGCQTRSFTYVSDMVNGLYALATKKNINSEIINLGNPKEKTIFEIARLVKELTNSYSIFINKDLPADDPKRRKPDITKAKKLLNWQPRVSLETGLKKTIEYFKNVLSYEKSSHSDTYV